MKEFYEKIKVELEVLTPVHIGSGERLSTYEYIYEEGRLKVYPFYYLLDRITEEREDRRTNILMKLRSGYTRLIDIFREFSLSYKPRYEIPYEGKPVSTYVEAFQKNMLGPYIPSSTIKGAIRTALISYMLMEREELYRKVKQELYDMLGRKPTKEDLKRYAENHLEGLLRPRSMPKDAKYDLLKALLLPDIQLSFEDLYGVEMKMVSSERHIFPCEALKPGTRAEFDMLLTVKTFETAKKITDTPPAQEKLRLKELKESVSGFYLQVIEQEIEYFKKKGMHKTVEAFEGIKQKANEGMLLRIGKHQGYISTTIMAVFRKKDRELFERVFELSAPQVREEKPKTRRITFDGKPMGWILLKLLYNFLRVLAFGGFYAPMTS